jgi:hypothetical protein
MFAHFLLDEGIGEVQIRPPSAESCSILSVENRAGALLHHRLPKNALCQGIAFQRGNPPFLSARTTLGKEANAKNRPLPGNPIDLLLER